MRRRSLACLLLLLLPVLGPVHGQTGALTIAAASDLQVVFPLLVSDFERRSGIEATTTFGSSGNFFAQIQNGAPFDVYFSADIDFPRRLAASGHADARTLYHYATGRLVLWARKDSGIDVTRGLRGLLDPRVRRIAIANPNVAPYGRAAVAALQAERLYDKVKDKLVRGDNVAQTAQLADSGNADAAIVSHSQVLGPALSKRGAFVEIPASTYPALEQGAIIVSATTRRAAAERFLAYVKTPAAQATLRRYGFTPPAR